MAIFHTWGIAAIQGVFLRCCFGDRLRFFRGGMRVRRPGYRRLLFLAFFLRASAAAFDALVAIAFRCAAVNRLALAWPPLRPIPARYSES